MTPKKREESPRGGGARARLVRLVLFYPVSTGSLFEFYAAPLNPVLAFSFPYGILAKKGRCILCSWLFPGGSSLTSF